MRYRLYIFVLGLAFAGAYPAAAQQNTTTGWQQPQPSYGVPMYVSPNGAQSLYGTQGTSASPVYNTSAQPFAMEQMVAGKNAPSYNFKSGNTFTGFNSNPSSMTSIGTMTPDQSRLMEMQRNAQAVAYQNEYLSSLQQQQQAQAAAPSYNTNQQATGATQLYNGFGAQQQQQPTRRRVVYRERNNPLTTPPRLFSID